MVTRMSAYKGRTSTAIYARRATTRTGVAVAIATMAAIASVAIAGATAARTAITPTMIVRAAGVPSERTTPDSSRHDDATNPAATLPADARAEGTHR